MMNAYSPANMRPNGTLGDIDLENLTWGDVGDMLTDAAKEKVTDLGTTLIRNVTLPGTGAGNSTPTSGAPSGQVTIIERTSGFGQWIADNPMLVAGGALAVLFLLSRRR